MKVLADHVKEKKKKYLQPCRGCGFSRTRHLLVSEEYAQR
jgi:hypothetical protein